MEPNSKKEAKIDKINRKRQVFKNQVLQQLIENYQGSNNPAEEIKIDSKDDNITMKFIDPQTQMKKAKAWWQNLDIAYFKPVKRKNILLTRDLTSGQKLINFFSLQTQLQSSYQNEEIYDKFPLLKQKTLIHVVFKSLNPFFMELVTYSFANMTQSLYSKITKTTKDQTQQHKQPNSCNIISCIKKLKSGAIEGQKLQQIIEEALKIGSFECQAILQDDFSIYKFEKTQKIKYQMQFQEEIEVQLRLWQNEIMQQSTQNSILWNNLISNHEKTIQTQPHDFSAQIFKIKQNLIHNTILRYIEHGTKDKTHQMVKQLLENMKMIKPAKTRQTSSKKFFETDCKICFCSFNSDSNQVLYCDLCNTSFHLACYGLHQVPQDKQYFCDRCTAIKKDQKTRNNIRKITCQICCKPNFPIKDIDGHFYHMTCLILFNFITIKQGRIQLREGLSHSKILSKVIQNQVQCQTCVFCVGSQCAQMGMQFRCSVAGCSSSMHPICAYINGCEFDVRKDMNQKIVVVSIRCNQHDCERDYIQQSYLRRYMCNFKNTSQKPLQLFRHEYQAETQSIKLKLESSPPLINSLPKIIIDTKVIRKHMSLRDQKMSQKQEQVQNTEIRRLLERLEKLKHKL